MCAAVLRLKRKATSEPIEGLVVAYKKSKSDEIKFNEVYFKFAATLKSEKESVKDHIQAALNKEKEEKFFKWRDPKSTAVSQKITSNICEKSKQECKAISEKKRLDQLNNRRLILADTVPIAESNKDASIQDTEVRNLFQLYDIIEESEEPKKQVETVSNITCNGKPLTCEKTDYVYDVYITNDPVDEKFINNTISLRPYSIANEDIYCGDSEDSEPCDEEEDSNDENNWRNEYPEDEDSHSEHDSEDEYDELDSRNYFHELKQSFERADLGDDSFDSDDESFNYSKIMEDVTQDDYGDSD